MQIGTHKLPNRVFLAPMAGVTDLPFRVLCKTLGTGLATSEMVSSNSLLWGSDKTKRRANHDGEPDPKSVQIVGADPSMMAEAARYNQDKGAHIIDINMGCPAKKVCNTLAGSALLAHEKLVAEILEAVVKAVEIPVTLKIRTGSNPSSKNGVRIAQIAENSGIQALAVHGRTRTDMFKGNAEYDTIRDIKQAVAIPVIANGDITTAEKAKEVLEYTGADAIMIGRAAQGRPWIFREIVHFLETGNKMTEPEIAEIRAIMLAHMQRLYEFYGEHRGVLMARKHVSWYSKGQPGGGQFRHSFNRLDSAALQLQLANEFFDTLEEKVNRNNEQ